MQHNTLINMALCMHSMGTHSRTTQLMVIEEVGLHLCTLVWLEASRCFVRNWHSLCQQRLLSNSNALQCWHFQTQCCCLPVCSLYCTYCVWPAASMVPHSMEGIAYEGLEPKLGTGQQGMALNAIWGWLGPWAVCSS
jgi:hypothetical protein